MCSLSKAGVLARCARQEQKSTTLHSSPFHGAIIHHWITLGVVMRNKELGNAQAFRRTSSSTKSNPTWRRTKVSLMSFPR
ncbi:unnamed protein product [Victoria cruziana]